MSEIVPTDRARDLALFEKQTLRAGLEVCQLSAAQLADLLGVEDDTVEAWLSPTRANHVPAWIYRHRRCPPRLRAFQRAEQDRHVGEPPDPACAVTLEEQADVATELGGQAISALVTFRRHGGFKAGAMKQLAVFVGRAANAFVSLEKLVHRRAVTGGHKAAKGGRP